MPNRFIRESCRSSRNLDKLSDFEERLFWRLLTTADDYGRFLADPEIVRAACFPYKSLSVEKVTGALLGLQSHHLITLYTVDDRQYGEFVTFQKHQGKARARAPKYPDREKRNLLIVNELDSSLHADASNGQQVPTVPARCATPPDTDTDTDLNSSLNSLSSSDSEFEQFWLSYPKKVGKKDAKRAWVKARDRPPLVDLILALNRQKESLQWQKENGQFIPNPSTWLNQGRWADQLAPKPKSLMEEFIERGAHGPGAVLQGLADARFATVGGKVSRSN